MTSQSGLLSHEQPQPVATTWEPEVVGTAGTRPGSAGIIFSLGFSDAVLSTETSG